MTPEAITAVARAVFGGDTPAAMLYAEHIIGRIEDEGMAVYKKKVFLNGRRPNSSEPMTHHLQAMIRETYRRDPTLTQQQIATIYNVNSGRVAEALR
jgi:hypothetical protein